VGVLGVLAYAVLVRERSIATNDIRGDTLNLIGLIIAP